MLYAALKTFHVLAIVLWVGGMLFAHFFLRPSLEVLAPPDRLKLMRAVLGRFFGAVLWAALITLASGLWMIGRVAKAAVQGGGSFSMPLDWTVMTVLGVLMVAIFGHIRFVLYKRFAAALDGGDMPGAAARLAALRQWVSVNLAIGLVIIVVALLI
jgi:uncharacterized membrane protein